MAVFNRQWPSPAQAVMGSTGVRTSFPLATSYIQMWPLSGGSPRMVLCPLGGGQGAVTGARGGAGKRALLGSFWIIFQQPG